MNLLVQFPTLRRKEKFIDCFSKYVKLTSGLHYVHFNILCDAGDETMNNDETMKQISEIILSKNDQPNSFHPSATIYMDINTEKISAINSHIGDSDIFDIIIVASDDMIPCSWSWDNEIAFAMNKHFPNLDGSVSFYDGYNKKNLVTFSILGRELYKEFGYIYHPDYKSLYCDNEFTEEINRMGKIEYIQKEIVRHEHYTEKGSVNSGNIDYAAKKTLHYSGRDAIVYERRKSLGFPKERITND